MRKRVTLALAASLVSAVLTAPVSVFAAEEKQEPNGQALAFDNKKGNCLACHALPGDAKAVTNTNIGPQLSQMKARFPERDKLRAQIWDATKNNPSTSMPPFGKHKILTEQEIDKITDYIYSL